MGWWGHWVGNGVVKVHFQHTQGNSLVARLVKTTLK
jgi:hypothetical protein